MDGVIDFLASIMAFFTMLLEGLVLYFWKSCFLFALAGLIVKIFSQQMNPRMRSYSKK